MPLQFQHSGDSKRVVLRKLILLVSAFKKIVRLLKDNHTIV